MKPVPSTPSAIELATFGGGCFWCLEAVFERLEGVTSVTSGYSGGHDPKPTYKSVCTGATGHAEVIQIAFNPARIAYKTLLDVFWAAHDPTTLNRQGPDVGTQYRSVIFYHSDAQRQTAEQSRATAAAQFKRPIVTRIEPLVRFFPAEGYHQDYFKNNPNYPYCQVVIRPKLEKLAPKLRTLP
ncbi:MAG TPA: peptide-methionine (S)-S-oxide reductase MsrA [Verrucomicrobiota bacterium]|nr:peptide-methionine (S)-S-oxide reductase MsrA [Verrucomicrobiota bacterium]HNU52247.1 peptide-methionine (S)-S-oxide reductase MsrA [Verrucomicrobiota bacterium]